MKTKNFYDEHHAKIYLENSVIRYKKIPIYIRDVNQVENEFKLLYNKLGRQTIEMTFLPNKHIDFNPVPLGFLNTQRNTFYVSRLPARQWKIGLHQNNIKFTNAVIGTKIKNPSLNSTLLANCILGKYPSYKAAYDSIISGKRFITAFSRKFAICKEGLLYKNNGQCIGPILQNPSLNDAYKYLKEI